MRIWYLYPVFILLSACSISVQRSGNAGLSFSDTVRTVQVERGIKYYYIHVPIGPWGVHVLDVNMRSRNTCYSVVAVKGAEGAVGRQTTSTLLKGLAQERDVMGGINADFFDLNGAPRGLLVSNTRLITGPTNYPILAFDSAGVPQITKVQLSGSINIGNTRYDVNGWNRDVSDGIALFDRSWGGATANDSSALKVILSGRKQPRVVTVDASKSVFIPDSGYVIVVGGNTPLDIRDKFLALKPGDTVDVSLSLDLNHPVEAVSGYPVLLKDSTLGQIVESRTSGFVTGRNSRAAVGISNNGKRLIFVVVDQGRKPYSVGMSLHELANMMLILGARDAINLDGSGSATLVYAGQDKKLTVANRAGDGGGALTVVKAPMDTMVGLRINKNFLAKQVVTYTLGIQLTIRKRSSSFVLLSGQGWFLARFGKTQKTTKDTTTRATQVDPQKQKAEWLEIWKKINQKLPVYVYNPKTLYPTERTVGDALAIVRCKER